MKSCALCGIIKLNTQFFNKKNNVYNKLNIHEVGCTPYGIANYLLSNYTTSNGEYMFLCLKCNIEYDAPTCGKYFVFQSQVHMKALLS
jgi:hypothetical protein